MQPTPQNGVCKFIGLLNYYCNVWEIHSHILAPLTQLNSSKFKFKHTEFKQKVFEEIKRILACNILSAYPDLLKNLKSVLMLAASNQNNLLYNKANRCIYTDCMNNLTIFLGTLIRLHQYISNLVLLLDFSNLFIEFQNAK